ncbi:hypothetical protein BX661DRAFT_183826 [Kickxella alabastrina]|uniref:uncharacterized protein n=1 Tax=Kickxella alabastrina TaxID=61397 RepID=UPI00221F845E|nr:uncharacterized protein BX661DRAFT_183826 [Kickxella alabastrina]KAI7826345.1 hypothetical protein BX661DRAFT_183826 [Kickxella alabastrina]
MPPTGQQLTDREAALLTDDINEEELDALTQSMRSVEQKLALVYTVFRSSIYAHLSQQEMAGQTQDDMAAYGDQFQTNCPPFE